MEKNKRCKGAMYLRRHKIIHVKGCGYRCQYCGNTLWYLSQKGEAHVC